MKNIIGLSRIEVPMQDLNLNYKKLNLDAKYIRAVLKNLRQLEDLLYKSDKIEVLDPQHTQILSFITQELNQILNEVKYHNTQKEIARYIETTLSMIDDWFYATGYTMRKRVHTKKK
jgi:lipoate-protein ligase A